MNEIRKQKPTALDITMVRTFEAETARLRTDVSKMRPGLARSLLAQELDLRERRLRQWKENPSGRPEEPFKSVTGY